MTRRAETEAMLQRYGEPAVSAGRTFPAIIRPLRFSSQTDAEDGGMDCLYTGPASQKLAAGDTVASAGGLYRVVQSETVSLSGEELYVRAVLAFLPEGADDTVCVERGGTVLALAESYAVRAQQACGAEIPWGADGAEEISAGSVAFELTLKNAVPAAGADLFGSDSFDVAVTRGKTRTVYSGCRWKTVNNTGGLTGRPVYDLEILAAKRGVSEQGEQTDG